MKTTPIAPHKSSLGLDANLVALIALGAAALFAWIPWVGIITFAAPLVFFFLEKESKFVKFQAVQATIIGAAISVINLIFTIIGLIVKPRWVYESYYGYRVPVDFKGSQALYSTFGVINYILILADFVALGYAAYMAFTYKSVELPVVGPIAEKMSAKLENVAARPQVPQNDVPPADGNAPQ